MSDQGKVPVPEDLRTLKEDNLRLRLLADHADMYWDDEDEHDSPEEYAAAADLELGAEFVLTASAYWKTRFRVTKVPDDKNDDFDTEQIDGRRAEFPEYFALKDQLALAESKLAEAERREELRKLMPN